MATELIPTFSSVTIFGDSLSDPGNLFNLTGFFPPSPYVDGRFANGDIWPDYFTESLNLEADQVSNFAIGGATTGSTNALEPLVEQLAGIDLTLPGLTEQVDSYITGLAGGSGDPDGLYVLWIGANDLLNLPTDPTEISGYLANSVNNVVEAISQVAAQGGDTFLVANLPDLGLTPRGLTSGNGDQVTTVSTLFNAELSNALQTLETTSNIDIVEVDIFTATSEIINSPATFGFTNVTDPLIEQLPPVDDGYFWWDDIHPTTVVHESVSDEFQAELLEAGYLLEPPEPLAELLDLTGLDGVVTVDVTLNREADFDNILQFYQTDSQGRVQGLLPGDNGYEDAVRTSLLATPQLFVDDLVTRQQTFTLSGGSYYAPALLVEGDLQNLVTIDDGVTGNDMIIRSGDVWSFEDWIDFDFNDLIVTLNSAEVVA